MTNKWTSGECGFSDDDVLYGADLNDTFEAMIKKDVSAVDSTEKTSTSKYYAGSGADNGSIEKTWTFTPPTSDAIILSIKIEGQCKIVPSSGTPDIAISGEIELPYDNSNTQKSYSLMTYSSSSTYTPFEIYFSPATCTDADNNSFNHSKGGVSGASSYDISLRCGYSDEYDSGTAYVNELKCTVWWIDGNSVKETTSSGLFS